MTFKQESKDRLLETMMIGVNWHVMHGSESAATCAASIHRNCASTIFHVQECNDSTGIQETEMHRAGEHTHALLLDERLSIDLKRSRDDILVMRADWSARAASCICTARARSN